jgi:ATP/maltotriose-dependent transcriptional regulator MalT
MSANLAGWLLFYAGWIHLDWGARGHAEDAWHRLADLAARTHEPVVRFFSLRADLILALLGGDLASAVALGDKLTQRAHEQGSPVLAWFHSSNLVYRPLLHLGRAAEAVDRAAIPAEARALGLTEVPPSLGAPQALCLAHAGRHAEARQELRRWVVDRRLGPGEAGAPTAALLQFLEAAVLTKDREMAALLAERLAGVAFLGVGRPALTCIARHLGAAAALLGRWDAARRYYQQALEVSGQIGFRPEAALTRLQLADLLLAQHRDQRSEAREHLEIAIVEFQAMGMQPALEQAQRLLERMSARVGERRSLAPVYPDGLTEREVEVLGLLAAGKSNREISAVLVLSVRTVERHIENVYVKTGMHSRTQATLYAQEHHLV